MTKIIIKKGDTLALSCSLKDSDGVPINLTSVTITSQVRNAIIGTLVQDLTVIITNAVLGEYTLTSADTSNWPVDSLQCDIKYVFSSPSTIRTETFTIDVKQAVTV